jgi:hypothetical protein
MIYLVNLSLVSNEPYPETSDATAVQRVIDAGGKNAFLSRDILKHFFFVIVYVTISMGNDGEGGLQTGGAPSNAADAMAVASIDNMHAVFSIIIAPDGHKIPYHTGALFGGWKSVVNSTIIVNS